MSLADELFACLESKNTDKGSSRELGRSRTGCRTPSYLTEQDERQNCSSTSQARQSSQERGGYEDKNGAGHYGRSDYGPLRRNVEGGRYDGKHSSQARSDISHERRSDSVGNRGESSHLVRDNHHTKRDRSVEVHSSKADLRPSRHYDGHDRQPTRGGRNTTDERERESYRTDGQTLNKRDCLSYQNSKRNFDDKSKQHYDMHDMPNNNPLEDRKRDESKNPQNSTIGGLEPSRPYKNETGAKKLADKHTKVDENADNVPFKLIGYRKLEDLVNGNPTELVVALANRHSGFENRLREKLSPDFIMLIVKALAKLCKADFHENKVGILSQACEPDFLNQVSDYLMKIPFEADEKRRSLMGEFLLNILTFYRSTMELLPDKACDKLPDMLETTDRAVKCAEACQAIKFPDALNEGLLDLDCRLKVRIGERDVKRQKPDTSGNVVRDETPPDNFREITIYPAAGDILNCDSNFIRPNIVKGAYSSVEHYLDIQFRLLREDFVCPLREGITDYMRNALVDGKCKKRINNIRIYRKVRFLAPKVVKDVVGLEVCFDSASHCLKVKWEHNRRFMFGSLLCFTKDNFANIFFGTVVERTVECLQKGRIIVELRQADHLAESMFHSDFIMVESEVYFEPYFHVLKALQKLEASTFPMRKYIVDVDISNAPPIYIQRQPDFLYNIDNHNVAVLDDATWPSAKELHLDESQYIAFKSALTREFVVIQGPPGTGKTYIGLKIAEVLLRNSPIWNASSKPILVVCYTNHALDQFLEGIIAHTDNIVRVGGQSKSEVLAKFNLKEQRRKNGKYMENANVPMLMRDIHSKMSSTMADIKLIQVDLESINNGKGVISLHTLKASGIRKCHLSNFFSSVGKIDDEIFLEWLEIGLQYCDDPQSFSSGSFEDTCVGTESTETEIIDIEGNPDEGAWQDAFDDHIEFIFDAVNITTHVKFALVLDALRQDISVLHQKLAEMDVAHDPETRKKCSQVNREIKEYQKCLNYWKNSVQNSDRCDIETAERLLLSENLWQLSPNERWIIYSYWVVNLKKRMLCDLRTLEQEVRTSAKRYEEVKQIGDLQVLKHALVIGMTTTGAARLQPLLQALKPRIVIVEEAAEVMESHIVVSLTNECQHLILIGDHKQLRPSTAVYKLAKEYKFDISLFERMLSNEMHCEILKVQHRMRPEIAQLIVPTIYPVLHNHESVMKHKQIDGVTKSVFFVTHNNPEEEACSSVTIKDRSEPFQENTKVASDASNMNGTNLLPKSTSTSIEECGFFQACGVETLTHLSENTSGMAKNSVSDGVRNTCVIPSASTSVHQNGLDQDDTDVTKTSRVQVLVRGENDEAVAQNPEAPQSSAAENSPSSTPHCKTTQQFGDQKSKEDQETGCEAKSLVDQSDKQIISTKRIGSLDNTTLQLEGTASIPRSEKETKKTLHGGSEFSEENEMENHKGPELISSACSNDKSQNDSGAVVEQTLEYEEVYARLGNLNVTLLKHGENDWRKDDSGGNANKTHASVVARCIPSENQLKHDSGSEFNIRRIGQNSGNDMEVHGKVNEMSSEYDSVSEGESRQVMTLWAGGTRGKVTKQLGVKSSRVNSRNRISQAELRSLRLRTVMLQSQEMHNLKMKFEVQKHEEELKLLQLQQEYWKKKLLEL